MIGLIFCDIVITGEELALVAALGTAAAVALNFVGDGIGILVDIVVTGGQAVALIGSAVAAGPAALAILLALGLTVPFALHIPI